MWSETNITAKMVKTVRVNRNKEDWLLGKACDKSLAIGSRLPLQLKVMRRFLSLRLLDVNKPTKQIFRVILDELKEIWGRAAIPIKVDRNCLRQLLKIHQDWFAITKIKIDSRQTVNSKKHIANFKTRMNTLCDLSPSDVENKLKASRKTYWKEDFMFLIGQREYPQRGRMANVDRNEAQRANIQSLRSSRTNTPSLPASNETSDESISVGSNESEDLSQFSSDEEYYEPRRTPRPSSVILEIPAKNLTKATGQVADSRDLSLRDHLTIQSALVAAGGGNINDFSMSLTTVHRQRQQLRKEISDGIKERFIPPSSILIHWDSKLIKYIKLIREITCLS